MIHRVIIGLIAGAALPSLAAAADLAEYYSAPPPEIAVPVGECSGYGPGRPYDQVWQPPQTAYILAARCGTNTGWFNQHEELFVYYNGGSMWKTDINVLVVK